MIAPEAADHATATLETLVQSIDELPADCDFASLPEEVRSILTYINVQCREVVRQVTA